MVIQGPKKIFANVSSPLVVVFCVGGRGQGGVRGRGRGVAAAGVAVGVGDHGGMHSLGGQCRGLEPGSGSMELLHGDTVTGDTGTVLGDRGRSAEVTRPRLRCSECGVPGPTGRSVPATPSLVPARPRPPLVQSKQCGPPLGTRAANKPS